MSPKGDVNQSIAVQNNINNRNVDEREAYPFLHQQSMKRTNMAMFGKTRTEPVFAKANSI
ncbi:MAG: hypothetical protein ACK521_07845 [bacterium]